MNKYFKSNEKNNFIPNELSNTWFLQDPIDEEHKYYILMNYLQKLDINVKNGHIFKEYIQLEQRYEDLVEYVINFNILNRSVESDGLFKNIYTSKNKIDYLRELDNIVLDSIIHIEEKYNELKSVLSYLKDNIIIDRKQIKDKRKKLNLYIEKCNSNILEHYEISKNGCSLYKGSISNTKSVSNEIELSNYIKVNSKIALDSDKLIVPFITNFTLSMNLPIY